MVRETVYFKTLHGSFEVLPSPHLVSSVLPETCPIKGLKVEKFKYVTGNPVLDIPICFVLLHRLLTRCLVYYTPCSRECAFWDYMTKIVRWEIFLNILVTN